MTPDELDRLTNKIEQGFQEPGGWRDCRFLLGKLVANFKRPEALDKGSTLADVGGKEK